MLFSKRHPSSSLAKSRSRLHEIITNGIVLKSTRRALLKNVQDGNSLEAEKLTKQKWEQYCGTPCTNLLSRIY